MARFLSDAWFARLGELTEPAGGRGAGVGAAGQGRGAGVGDAFVVEQVVERDPEGQVRYHVVITGSHARVVAGPAAEPQLVLTSDYATAGAIARGELPAETALLEGRIRVRGDMERLSQRAPELSGIDPVPPRLRDETSY